MLSGGVGVSQVQARLLLVLTHDTCFLAIPVALLLGGALVMKLLAAYQGQFAFDQVLFPVEFERHAGVPLLLRLREDLGDFLAMQEQLAGPGRVRQNVCARRVERHDMATQQPGLPILDQKEWKILL